MPVLHVIAMVSVAVLVAPSAAAAAPKTKTHRVASGTTTLTLAPTAVDNLARMGVSMLAGAPATTEGPCSPSPSSRAVE